ncbi:YgaP family membrane protein [Orrella sp. 11846]|uniref:YgaP family membrane protein n=1 Tax=Orrella sp. 11846 TaxID=3409913 RepID=UPI003B5A1CD9
MKINLGGLDRGIRVIVGVVLIVLALMGTIGPWGWIGLIPLLTGLFGNCPVYSIFKINTCPLKK